MQDPPSTEMIAQLVEAQVRAPGERSKFEARVASAALELVRRAAALAPESDAAERKRLEHLLGETDDLAALNRRLCVLIREGALGFASPGLAAHVRVTALEKLAIDQPTYAAYRRALETNEG